MYLPSVSRLLGCRIDYAISYLLVGELESAMDCRDCLTVFPPKLHTILQINSYRLLHWRADQLFTWAYILNGGACRI